MTEGDRSPSSSTTGSENVITASEEEHEEETLLPENLEPLRGEEDLEIPGTDPRAWPDETPIPAIDHRVDNSPGQTCQEPGEEPGTGLSDIMRRRYGELSTKTNLTSAEVIQLQALMLLKQGSTPEEAQRPTLRGADRHRLLTIAREGMAPHEKFGQRNHSEPRSWLNLVHTRLREQIQLVTGREAVEIDFHLLKTWLAGSLPNHREDARVPLFQREAAACRNWTELKEKFCDMFQAEQLMLPLLEILGGRQPHRMGIDTYYAQVTQLIREQLDSVPTDQHCTILTAAITLHGLSLRNRRYALEALSQVKPPDVTPQVYMRAFHKA